MVLLCIILYHQCGIKGVKKMKEVIGETAGRIWQVLNDKGETDASSLPRILKAKTFIVYQALGWLAREDKLKYVTKKGKILVSLTE